MNYAIRSSLYLLLLILDNIVSSDRVSVSSEVSQYLEPRELFLEFKILTFTDTHKTLDIS